MEHFRIGQIVKPQGIKGEVKLRVYTDDIAHLASVPYVFLKDRDVFTKMDVEHGRTYKDFLYLKLSGCDDRNTAEALRGRNVYIDRENAAPLEEGAHYIADLIGLAIVDSDGAELGTVAEVLQTGGVDIYRVSGPRPFMFPAAKHVVLNVDTAAGVITVDSQTLPQVALYE